MVLEHLRRFIIAEDPYLTYLAEHCQTRVENQRRQVERSLASILEQDDEEAAQRYANMMREQEEKTKLK